MRQTVHKKSKKSRHSDIEKPNSDEQYEKVVDKGFGKKEIPTEKVGEHLDKAIKTMCERAEKSAGEEEVPSQNEALEEERCKKSKPLEKKQNNGKTKSTKNDERKKTIPLRHSQRFRSMLSLSQKLNKGPHPIVDVDDDIENEDEDVVNEENGNEQQELDNEPPEGQEGGVLELQIQKAIVPDEKGQGQMIEANLSGKELKITNHGKRKQRTGESKTQKKEFVTRMFYSNFVSMLPDLTLEQRQAVTDMGFGSFLDFDLKSIPGKFSKFLVENFDPYAVCLRLPDGQKIDITEIDVYKALGLPLGGREIVEVDPNCKDPEFLDVLQTWKNEWGIRTGSSLLTRMPGFILNQKDGGESFKRNFTLYFVSCFISGPKNQYCNRSFLINVRDIKQISSLDWCQFVVKKLVESIRYRKEHVYDVGANFDGPVIFLLMLYLDRVKFVKRTIVRDFPTIKNWKNDQIKKRINDEESTGAFGRGVVEPPIEVQLSQLEQPQVADRHTEEKSMSEVEKDISEMANVTNQLVMAYKKFTAQMAYMSNKYEDNDALRKIRDGAIAMFSSFY